jgi:hypothetical protein
MSDKLIKMKSINLKELKGLKHKVSKKWYKTLRQVLVIQKCVENPQRATEIVTI